MSLNAEFISISLYYSVVSQVYMLEFLSGGFQGGLTATDVFAAEWIHTGAIHFGMTVTYFGFISDGN